MRTILRRCSKCHTVKKLKFFPIKVIGTGRTGYCLKCQKAARSRYFKKYKKSLDRVYGRNAVKYLRDSAKLRKIKFSLNHNMLKKWWESTPDVCYYCGFDIHKYRRLRNKILAHTANNRGINKFKNILMLDSVDRMTIDRKSSNCGYKIENIVKCCWICNCVKGTFLSSADMKKVAPGIMKRLISRLGGIY
jgi:hypothetical protein